MNEDRIIKTEYSDVMQKSYIDNERNCSPCSARCTRWPKACTAKDTL